MNSVILSKSYDEPPFCKREILRYAGCKEDDGEISVLLDSCLCEVRDKLTYRVCYREFSVVTDGDICDFGMFCLQSENLRLNLGESKKAVIFAATVGIGIDRLCTRHSKLSPSRALMLQAIGTERIEALCDVFCADIAKEYGLELKPRFSPGYGDLPLSAQRQIFDLLDPQRKIGLTLNNSLLMSPSKSVTAIVGLYNDKKSKTCDIQSFVSGDVL